MPLSKYNVAFGGKPGSAEKTAAGMKSTYGDRWKRVFYATKNARLAMRRGRRTPGRKDG